RRDHMPQVASLVGQSVVEPRRMLAVGNLHQDTRRYQPREALVEDVARDPETFLHLVKARDAEEHVANYQQRPPLTDDLEALRDRAVHLGEALAFHRIHNSELHDGTQSDSLRPV